MKKHFFKILFCFSVLTTSNVFASSYFTASIYNLELGGSTVLNWGNYYPNLYQNPTYNLYVYKPSGEAKYKFRSGISETSMTRANIRMSGRHTFEVEVCDSSGNNCVTNTNGRVSVNVDHGCSYGKYTIFGYSYKCDGNIITQTIGDGTILGGIDTISEFISIRDRIFWKFWDASMTRYAYYSSCRSGGSLTQVTDFAGGMGVSNSINNFTPRTNGYAAEWSYWYKVGDYSTFHSVNLGQC